VKTVKTEEPKPDVNRERLDIRDGKFALLDARRESEERVRGNSYWKSHSWGFSTDNLGAAAKFRGIAVPKVERIFKRIFQEWYRLPRSFGGPKANLHLDDHQVDGIDWILTRKRSYLAHAPGAGKTAQVILAACLAEGEGQTVFVVPPALVKNWEREIWKFTEWLDVFPTIGIVGASDEQESVAWRAQFIIVPDSMLAKPWVYARLEKMKVKFLAVDEASRFKEPTAERTVALFGGRLENGQTYSGIHKKARHAVLLDGSPMPNRPIELWAPVYAMDPESIDCMNYDDFGMRYGGAKPNARGTWEYKYSSHEDELKKRLQKSFMHVVHESELDHPERLRSILVMTDDVRSREHRAWERKNPIVPLSGVRVVSSWSEDRAQGEMARFRRELGIRKVPWVAAYVRDRLEQKGESILLFAWHREVAISLFERLSGHVATEPHAAHVKHVGMVIGGTPPKYREEVFRRFQAGECKVLIMNIAAGGRGHNLPNADRVVFAEYSWTDETNKQAEKRASRRGSHNMHVRCEYVVCPDSMDEIVLNSVFTKEKRVKKVIG